MKLRTDRRGVSEAISFVLIFSLIVMSVGLVYAVGAQELTDVRDYERLNNAERAFDIFADNVEDVSHGGAPSRGTEIKLADASLRFAEDESINVTAGDDSVPTDLSAVVLEVDGVGRLRYSNGAVIRDDARGGATMVRRPSAMFDGDRVFLPLVSIDPRGSSKVAGSKTVRIRTEREGHRSLELASAENATYDSVTVNVTSPYAAQWGDYFESEGFDCALEEGADAEPGTVSCTTSDVERVTVGYTGIETTFE